jgi:hypothetical protein
MIPSSRNQLALAGVSDAATSEASRVAATLAALLSAVPSSQMLAVIGFVLAEGVRQTQEIRTAADTTIDAKIVEWAVQSFDPEAAAANLREIRETGGVTLADFDGELERLAQG